jgi:adenylate cyclase
MWMTIPAAHVTGALLAVVSSILTESNIKHQGGFGRVDVIVLVIYMPASLLLGGWWSTRLSHGTLTWLDADRVPTPTEQRATLALPWKLAAQSMVGWIGAAALWSVITIWSHDAAYTLRVGLSILLGGLTTCGLIYLIAEWLYRPVVARTLASGVPERAHTPGVRLKLLLTWAIGADVFLFMIGLTFVGRPRSEPPGAAAIWFIVIAGLAAGSVVLYVASRSLVTPLVELRHSVRRVQGGDLDVQVAVNDGGELGLLQAGFNQMVAGLRERRALQDLFGRHVGADVARQALEQGVTLGGERREVAVIFVDVLGSTALAQRESPEAVLDLLNRFFGTVVRVIAAEGGWVNKFEGDGALCIFGAPVGHDDVAVRALRAGRTLRRELLALGAAHPELDAAIGISAGTVVAGNVGAEQRYEYTVIGPPVNEASRLTDEAKHRLGRVLASEEAVARAGLEAHRWMVAGELHLRGHAEGTLAYEPAEVARVEGVART